MTEVAADHFGPCARSCFDCNRIYAATAFSRLRSSAALSWENACLFVDRVFYCTPEIHWIPPATPGGRSITSSRRGLRRGRIDT